MKNPRKNDPAVAKCAASIREYGFGTPLLARLDNREIIAGDTRIQAAQSLGMLEVPVRYMSLGELKAHALALADNAVGDASDWDRAQLAEQVRLLAAEGENLGALGFEDEQLGKMLAEPEVTQVSEVDVSDVADEFWMSVRGPLPKQPDVLERLRAAIASIDGISIEMGTVE